MLLHTAANHEQHSTFVSTREIPTLHSKGTLPCHHPYSRLLPFGKGSLWIRFFYRWLQFFGFLCLRMKGVTLYWTTSSAYGLVQNLILLSPKVRRKLRIPLTPSENTHPYRRIREKLLAKLKWVNQEKMKTYGINCVHSFSIKYVTILWCVKRIFMFSFAIFTCEAIFNLNDWNFMRITYLSEMNALT